MATPITNVEEAKHDLMTQLEGLTDTDHIMICMDSIGNLASKKEVEDALEGKSVADMTRAKALKSLFRMITPHLTMKAIPFVCVNHSYQTIEMYSKTVVGGGTGAIYGANDIWILGRQQETKGEGKDKEFLGYRFIINIEKSRTVKEKSKIPIYISYEHGIHRWSGLFDLAEEFGLIVPATGKGRANTWILEGKDPETEPNNFKRADIENEASFWQGMLAATDLKALIKEKYKLQTDNVILGDETAEIMNLETGEVE